MSFIPVTCVPDVIIEGDVIVDGVTIDGVVTVEAVDLDIRNLDCATDSITVCGPLEIFGSVSVSGTVPITGPVEIIDSGGFTPVAASRWFDTDSEDLTLLGTTDLVLTSPDPAAGQVVVVTDLSYFIELAVALALTSITVVVRQVSDETILWAASVGFAASIGAGATNSSTVEDIYVYGGDGEQLELVATLEAGIGVTASISANFGGFIATL